MTETELKKIKTKLKAMLDDAKAMVTRIRDLKERCPDTLRISDYSLDVRIEDVEVTLEYFVEDIAIELRRANEYQVVTVKETEKSFGKDSRQGIHLLNPEEFELERAIEDAHAQGFKTVWVHRSKSKLKSQIENRKAHV